MISRNYPDTDSVKRACEPFEYGRWGREPPAAVEVSKGNLAIHDFDFVTTLASRERVE
ncbi:MAG: hypothetical protein BWY17_05097 [Deltaproteobacteria bacterium ADurb.Bin207]|jgi:hypothetical protein|nr:MAG: hypothetical protein BWY17_05097 [Deltaproteobacteria bacterium ADurb.Bin207]